MEGFGAPCALAAAWGRREISSAWGADFMYYPNGAIGVGRSRAHEEEVQPRMINDPDGRTSRLAKIAMTTELHMARGSEGECGGLDATLQMRSRRTRSQGRLPLVNTRSGGYAHHLGSAACSAPPSPVSDLLGSSQEKQRRRGVPRLLLFLRRRA
jgi:hypothetical protein